VKAALEALWDARTKEGAAACRAGVCYDMNPYVTGGPAEAERCRVREWSPKAQAWHQGWKTEATERATALEKEAVL